MFHKKYHNMTGGFNNNIPDDQMIKWHIQYILKAHKHHRRILLLMTVRMDLIRWSICVFMPGSSPKPLWSEPQPTGTQKHNIHQYRNWTIPGNSNLMDDGNGCKRQSQKCPMDLDNILGELVRLPLKKVFSMMFIQLDWQVMTNGDIWLGSTAQMSNSYSSNLNPRHLTPQWHGLEIKHSAGTGAYFNSFFILGWGNRIL